MILADSGMWLDFVIIHENSWNNASYGDDSPYSPAFQWRHSEETIIHPDDLIVFYWNYRNNDIMKISAGNKTWLAMFIPPRKKTSINGKMSDKWGMFRCHHCNLWLQEGEANRFACSQLLSGGLVCWFGIVGYTSSRQTPL
jgi:hypothetical protein